MNLPGWVPVATAAETVGRSHHTVWTWVKRGLVRTYRIDHAVYVSVIDVAAIAARTPRRHRHV